MSFGPTQIQTTIVTAVLRPDYIGRMVETLYKHTPIGFRLIVVDQTKDGLPAMDGVHLVLRPSRNLGFAKAMNEGIIHGLHWKTPYIACINDDVEFIDDRWWYNLLEAFEMESDREVLIAAPESIRIPMWGYGMTHGEYIEIMEYKPDYTPEDYEFLQKGDFSHLPAKYDWLPKSFPLNYVGVCDAMAAWCPVFKRKAIEEIGLWDELFYPGGGEDYDMMGRIYSRNFRAISTRRSWVWHWWGKSKDEQKEAQVNSLPIEDTRKWCNLGDLWRPEDNEGNNLDVWGFYTGKDGRRIPFKRVDKVHTVMI